MFSRFQVSIPFERLAQAPGTLAVYPAQTLDRLLLKCRYP